MVRKRQPKPSNVEVNKKTLKDIIFSPMENEILALDNYKGDNFDVFERHYEAILSDSRVSVRVTVLK